MSVPETAWCRHSGEARTGSVIASGSDSSIATAAVPALSGALAEARG